MRKSPWKLDVDEVFALRGDGGVRFTDFIDALIRAEAQLAGMSPIGNILTNIRVNLGDGGVDTDVVKSIPNHQAFSTPTVWQYKATDFTNVTAAVLEEEVRKPHATKRIREGAAYRVCVCDDTTAELRSVREEALQAAVAALNPNAPPAKLLGASDLATWASRFPAIVARFFRPYLADGALSYSRWAEQARADLSEFVLPAAWADGRAAIAAHADFEAAPKDAVLAIAGGIGVGKTRLVFEGVADAADLVVYQPDHLAAVRLAGALLNDERFSALLVVDDCSLDSWHKLAKLVRDASRVRVIVILEATAEAPRKVSRVPALAEDDGAAVLKANFPAVAATTRLGVARLCEGALRVAAKLCRDLEHESTTFVEASADAAEQMLAGMVPDDVQRRVLEGLSLFQRVGFAGTVSSDLEILCRLTGLDARELVRVARALAKSPGLVHVGHRYLAVRPRLFARALLRTAWGRWAEPDEGAFLDELPPDLRPRLFEQLALHGTDEIREAVGRWADPWLDALTKDDLLAPATWRSLLPVVQLHPRRHLPILRKLVQSLSLEERRRLVTSPSPALGLVSVLEELGSLAELYPDVEATLHLLALAESPGQHGSGSASSRWASSFRVFLSGTAAPFDLRIARLRERFTEAESDAERALVLLAIDKSLDTYAFRMMGSPLVAGGPRSRDWQPRTHAEWAECTRATVTLLQDGIMHDDFRGGALGVLRKRGRQLLRGGFLDEVAASVSQIELTPEQRVAIEAFVEEFLDYDSPEDKDEARRPPPEYVARVRDWLSTVRGTSLVDRIESALGARTTRAYLKGHDAWLAEIRQLAEELFADQALLVDHLPRLMDRDFGGRGVFELGELIGTLDVSGVLLSPVLTGAMTASNPLFARGYAFGFAKGDDQRKETLAAELDAREEDNAAVALDLTVVALGEEPTVARATRLVTDGKLPPAAMSNLWRNTFTVGSLVSMVEALLRAPPELGTRGAQVAVDLLGYPVSQEGDATYRESEEVRQVAWRALEGSVADAGSESYWWGRLLDVLAPYDVDRAIAIACRGLVSEDLAVQEEATRSVATLAAEHGRRILAELEGVLRDPDAFLMLSVGPRMGFWGSFPESELEEWLERQPIATVRLVAAHLRRPHLDNSGKPVVPRLTEFVLSRYEADDGVFAAFCMGAHGLQIYMGDIAAQKSAEAKAATQFYTHPLRRIREWARRESNSAESEARTWRELDEERFGD